MTSTLTFACGRTDRTEALFAGLAGVPGIDLTMIGMRPSEIFPRALNRAEFDIAELSASSYLIQLSRGDCDYVALPVFLSRSFRFDAIYVRSDRGIESPADLIGRKVGTPEFQMTAGVWVRGILKDGFNIDPRDMTYVTGGLNTPGRNERIPIALGPDFHVERVPDGETLNGLISSGEIDAIIAPEPPTCFRDQSAPIARLFPDWRSAEKGFFTASGIFPIMHLVAVRRAVLDKAPELARQIYDACLAARDAGYRRLEQMAGAPSLPLMLPFLSAEVADTKRILGKDFWPYGVAANVKTLDALCRYSHDQSLAARLVTPDELFHPDLRDT